MDNLPKGLRGALKRSSKHSHPRAYYQLLAKALNEVSDNERRIFSHQHNLDRDFLELWSLAPADFRSPDFLSIFRDRAEFEELLVSVDVLEKAGLDRAAIISRVSKSNSSKTLSVAVRALLALLEFQQAPVSGDAELGAVKNVAELNKFALLLRNCSASHIFDILAGRSYFYVIRPESPVGMVHLEREDGKWILADMVGKSNRPVSRKIADPVFEYFESRGILRSVSCRPSEWDSVRQFCRMHHGMM